MLIFNSFVKENYIKTRTIQSMKIRTLNYFLIFCLSSIVACVSPQQYETLLQENEFLEEENNVLREEVAIKEKDNIVETKLEADVIRLERDLKVAQNRYTTLEKTYKELSTRYGLVMQDKGGNNQLGSIECQAELEAMKMTMDTQNRQMRIIELTLQERETQIKDLERLLHTSQYSN